MMTRIVTFPKMTLVMAPGGLGDTTLKFGPPLTQCGQEKTFPRAAKAL